jgi:predicted metal-dependent hydrolase
MAVVGIAGAAAWVRDVESALRPEDSLLFFQDRSGYVARLTDAGVGLVLVDGGDEQWRFWTTTPKVSAATRRIPVVLVTEDAVQRDDALLGGANLVLTPDELGAALPELLTDLARVPDAALLAELERQCEEPLPPEAVEAVRRFNSGEFYKQHDLFEALWMQESGAVRQLYQGVLQVGIAYFQITRGNARGAHKMLLRSNQWLAALPAVCQGINIAQLRADAAQVRAELERVGEDGLDRFDKTLLKPVQMVK